LAPENQKIINETVFRLYRSGRLGNLFPTNPFCVFPANISVIRFSSF
jgi:hypothetical protein